MHTTIHTAVHSVHTSTIHTVAIHTITIHTATVHATAVHTTAAVQHTTNTLHCRLDPFRGACVVGCVGCGVVWGGVWCGVCGSLYGSPWVTGVC